jgi:hypothetical protein
MVDEPQSAFCWYFYHPNIYKKIPKKLENFSVKKKRFPELFDNPNIYKVNKLLTFNIVLLHISSHVSNFSIDLIRLRNIEWRELIQQTLSVIIESSLYKIHVIASILSINCNCLFNKKKQFYVIMCNGEHRDVLINFN